MNTNKISILFFGQLTELTGKTELELSGIEDTLAAQEILKDLFPKLGQTPYLLALDREIIHENIPLKGNHTLALLPPYAGG
ncbi:MAG: MoaD/ThiS family protein [Saprospiraceae bacterium]|nr:MoaD/ThiS family protein [Saprospiraceae bacterium]